MSPPPSSSGRKESGPARFLGAASSGVLELIIFHPIDTVSKRLMNNRSKVFGSEPVGQGLSKLNSIIFKDAAAKGTLSKYISLFPGLGFAAGYKILQRIYKFGGQPYVNDFLDKNYKSNFKNTFGDRHAKTMMHATAGSLVGIGEIVLLPLDALKIKMQTNAGNYSGQSLAHILRQEGISGLYRGASWTAARNAPGSFALFGGSAITKEHIFGLENYSKATFFQNFIASIAGAVASITVSAPLDVIKTRIQAKSASQAEAGWVILKNMVAQEGFGAFFKGLTPKILIVGPKLVFSFTVAQQLIPLFDTLLKSNKAPAS